MRHSECPCEKSASRFDHAEPVVECGVGRDFGLDAPPCPAEPLACGLLNLSRGALCRAALDIQPEDDPRAMEREE